LHSLRQALRPPFVAALALALALGVAAVASGAPALSILTGPNGPTRDTTPAFTFDADDGATVVECSIDQGTPDYEPCADTAPYSSGSPLADGDYTFRVRAVDAAEEETVATRGFTVDTEVPTLTLTAGPSGPVADATPTFVFTGEAGAALDCSVDQGTPDYAPCSSPHTPTLSDGSYSFRVRATDAAGNTTARTRDFSVDTAAPATAIDAAPATVSSDTTPTFEFHTTEAGADLQCRLDSSTFSTCSSPRSYGPLADGSHSFAVRAVDDAGNVGAEQTVGFAVDTVAPALTIGSGPEGPTNDDVPAFGFSAETGTNVECSVDQGSASWGPCSAAGSHSPATLADGSYTFRVRATDGAANVTTRTRAFSVDTVAPETTITSLPHGTTSDDSPSFSFSSSEGGVTFECRLDGPTFSGCSSPKSYGTLAGGDHAFAVRARDAAGNVGAEQSETLTIDLINPALAIVEGPAGATNDSTPTFGFNAESGTTVECSVDQGVAGWGPCSDPAEHDAGPLADGGYTFRVRATDGAGRQTTQTRAFTVDTVAPSVTIQSGPAGPSNSPNPSFAFAASEGGVSFECRRDAESFAPCGSPKAYANLPDGPHSFHVRATDAAGNVAAVVSRSFSIDTVAPTISIGFGPSGTTTDDSPFFEFSAGGDWSAVECSLDQGTPGFGACSSAVSHAVAQRLGPGTYTFRVRASDPAGNSALATRTFTVSTGATVPPGTVPTDPPPPPPVTAPKLMTPFPLVRLSGRVTATGAKVKVLSVRAPRGASVRVRVTPRCAAEARCRAKVGAATPGRTGLVRFKRFEVAYRSGTTIEIRVSQAGLIGKYTRFVIRRSKAPQRLDRCLMPGTTSASRCPAG
jgi:hypothetical protein